MCNRCHWAWLPMNHPKSHGITSFGEKFHRQSIFAIRSPFAELRRTARMGKERLLHRHGPSLRETRERIERRPG